MSDDDCNNTRGGILECAIIGGKAIPLVELFNSPLFKLRHGDILEACVTELDAYEHPVRMWSGQLKVCWETADNANE